jgi:hypothetical protein
MASTGPFRANLGGGRSHSIISSARTKTRLKRAHLGNPACRKSFYGARGFAFVRVRKLSTLVPIPLYISARLPCFPPVP